MEISEFWFVNIHHVSESFNLLNTVHEYNQNITKPEKKSANKIHRYLFCFAEAVILL